VSRGRALALAATVGAWAAAGAAPAAAQVIPAQPARYLLTAAVADARAVWVNPAALARRLEATLGIDVTADRLAGGAQLSQYGATISSRSVAFSWAHDRFADRSSTDAFAIGVGLGDEALSVGGSRRWLRGTVRASFWDLAARAAANPWLQVSVVGRNFGSPTPRDSGSVPSLVPGVSTLLFGGAARAAAEWEVATRGWRSREWRVGGAIALTRSWSLLVRADLSPGLGRRRFAVALHLEAPTSRATVFSGLPAGVDGIDAVGLSGSLVARSSRLGR
jgi:hypothetical protein